MLGGNSRGETQAGKKTAVGSASKGLNEKVKFQGFTQDNWNSNDLQKMLQLENIKKGLVRKSSKDKQPVYASAGDRGSLAL